MARGFGWPDGVGGFWAGLSTRRKNALMIEKLLGQTQARLGVNVLWQNLEQYRRSFLFCFHFWRTLDLFVRGRHQRLDGGLAC